MTTVAFQSELARAAAELRQGRPESAERIYRDILAQAPAHAIATHYLGVTLVQSGRTEDGLALVTSSMPALQGDASYRHNYALTLAQAGRLVDAERELEAAIALAPRAVPSHHYLAIVRQQRGRLEEAAAAYRAALQLAPDEASVAANYGFCLLEKGDAAGAAEWLRRAVAGAPQNAVAHNNLGCALRALGALQESIASARNAVTVDPHYAAGWYNLGLALRDGGDAKGAFDALCRAVREGPDFAPAWQAFADEFARARFTVWDAAAAQELTRALSHPAIDPAPLAAAAASLLMLDPAFGPLLRGLPGEQIPDSALFEGEMLHRLAHPMLLALIEHAVVPDAEFEALLTALRARAIHAWSTTGLKPSPELAALLAVLAQQCFLNEYVWPESAAEAAAVEQLTARVTARDTRSAAQAGASGALPGEQAEIELLLLGAYRPLGTVAGHIPAPPAAGPAAGVWLRHVTEPAVERGLRDRAPVLTSIQDSISRAVQHQYEENPYPRWHRLPGTFATPFPLRRALYSLFPHADLSGLRVTDAPDILIAGCGTGYQAAISAARNPGARITAVDLSRTSLGFAMRRCDELRFTNVRFAQADIMSLRGLTQQYDCVECTGVLHHLGDPLAGWSILAALVKPGGVMQVALYSALARRPVFAARELIARRGFTPDLAGIRAARSLVLAQPPGAPARLLVDSPDFFTASGARDLMLHVEEHCFDLPQVEEALAALGLKFLGFELADPAVGADYRRRFPQDLGANSLANWAQFEQEHPHVFAGMYQFWVLKPA